MKYKIYFKCPKCLVLWDEEFEARDCCKPDVVITCSACSEVFKSLKKAKECFDKHEEKGDSLKK